MRKSALLLVSLAVMLVCAFVLPDLFGWGQHRYHGDLVRQTLASSLTLPDGKDRFSKKEWDEYVELYSYYPDWGAGGASSPRRTDDLWDYYLDAQVQYRIEGTHSLRATVQYFKLLLDNLAAGESRKGAMWAGCLTHVIGDAAAANHPPLLMYLTYCHGPLGLTIGSKGETISRELKWIDVAGPSEDPNGKKIIQEGLRDYKSTLLADNAEEAAIQIQILLHDNWMMALKEEAKIAQGYEKWIAEKDAHGKDLMLRGMGRIIVSCTRDTANAIYTAHVLAQKKQTFDVNKALEKGRPRIAEHRKGLLLSQASIYDGLLRETSDAPAVGVFLGVPPIYWVSGGSVDLQFCYIMNLIGRTLADQKVPYVTFDMKAPPASLDPKKIPVVVLPPYRQADGLVTADLEKMLQAYREAGGKILFVGGHPGPAIEPLTRHLMRNPDGDNFYPLKTKEMPGTKLILLDETAQPVGEVLPVLQVLKDFDVRAFGAYVSKSETPANITPVVVLDTGEKRLAVSNGLLRNDAIEVIYAPWYFFMPGLLSPDKQVHKLDQPTLDTQGRRVLNHLLGLLKAKK